MPTYEYECRACEHRFEAFQSMTARPLRKCPECGKSALARLIGTGAAVLFKGSGFYQTDYRSESYKKAAEAEKKAASAGHASADKPGDKPAAKADKKPAKGGPGSKKKDAAKSAA